MDVGLKGGVEGVGSWGVGGLAGEEGLVWV